jgi:hypothetical protein
MYEDDFPIVNLDDDDQPETQAGPADDETGAVADFTGRLKQIADDMEVVGVPSATGTHRGWLAWSEHDASATEAGTERPSWNLVGGHAAVMVGLCVAGAVVIAIGGFLIIDHHDGGSVKTTVADTMTAAAPRIAVPPSTVTVPAVPTTVTLQAAPTIRTALPACYHGDPVEEKPTSSSTWCRHHWYENLRWTSWTPTSADGTGIQILQNCTPSCAQGQMWRTPVEVHFSDSEPGTGRLRMPNRYAVLHAVDRCVPDGAPAARSGGAVSGRPRLHALQRNARLSLELARAAMPRGR